MSSEPIRGTCTVCADCTAFISFRAGFNKRLEILIVKKPISSELKKVIKIIMIKLSNMSSKFCFLKPNVLGLLQILWVMTPKLSPK